MPKLLVFVPCEKLIMSQGENTPTVISIMTEVRFFIDPPDAKLPEGAMGPFRWTLFSMWQCSEADKDHEYRYRVQLISDEDGRALFDQASPLRFRRAIHHVMTPIDALPMKIGQYSIRLLLDDALIADYPLRIARADVPRHEDIQHKDL